MMPPQEITHRHQIALLWAADGTFDNYGAPNVAATPVEIKVRWENLSRDSRQPLSGTRPIIAKVHVNRDILIGSQIWLGDLDEWASLSASGGYREVCEVVSKRDVPDVKGRARRKTLDVARLGDH